MTAKVSLSAQADAVRLILDHGAIDAMQRKRTMRESEAALLRDRLSAAAETLGMFAAYEGVIRDAIRKARGEAP